MAAAPPPPPPPKTVDDVIRASEWITNKLIKIPVLEDHCSTANFRAWNVKFERYLQFQKLDYIYG